MLKTIFFIIIPHRHPSGGNTVFIPIRLIKHLTKKVIAGKVQDMLTEIFSHHLMGYFVSATTMAKGTKIKRG